MRGAPPAGAQSAEQPPRPQRSRGDEFVQRERGAVHLRLAAAVRHAHRPISDRHSTADPHPNPAAAGAFRRGIQAAAAAARGLKHRE